MVKPKEHRKSYRRSYQQNKTNKNITRKNLGSQTIIGVIHANWCGHCQMLMPKWKLFKKALNGNKNITIIEIEDGDHDKDQRIERLNLKINDKSVRLQASGFPTIFKIQHGHLEYYNGNREPGALKHWALGKQKRPLPTPLPVKKPMGLFGLF
jgi:thiol-disulfide isomerase/thioredoxin